MIDLFDIRRDLTAQRWERALQYAALCASVGSMSAIWQNEMIMAGENGSQVMLYIDDLFWYVVGLFWYIVDLFWYVVGLFWYIVGLFWYIVGLFCHLYWPEKMARRSCCI